MPKLVAASGSVIVTEPAAHHYRFVGIEFSPARGSFLHDLVQLGLNHTDVDDLPHHVIFDRCYLHGDPQKGTRRGIAMNSRSTAVIDSYLSDFKEVGADSQAIAGWNGRAFKIATVSSKQPVKRVRRRVRRSDLCPDIEIRGNHRPNRSGGAPAGLRGHTVVSQNLFELKRRRGRRGQLFRVGG
jgi:hypothetical protein